MIHLEGRFSVLAALHAGLRRFEVVCIAEDVPPERSREIVTVAGELGVTIRTVPGAELETLTHGQTHGGIVAVCSPKPLLREAKLLNQIKRLDHPALLLLLEGIDDARNLGFVLRTAEAMNVDAVLLRKRELGFDETEVARPSSGAFERMPLLIFHDIALLKRLRRRGVQLIGCLANAKRVMYDADLRQPTILAVGGEKRGLSGQVRSICDCYAHIPTAGGASSLSTSHAAAIVLAEAARQRWTPANENV
ncbi:MAG: RNA methyltransferase [Phycisphaeraceae bacterium]|nr:RNA methyltransferase [Phycisphaeraceae bacterium]